MATRVTDEFGSRANPPDAAYPDGSLKNETTPGVSNDGSPLESRVGNDWEGFKQSVLTEAGVTANGNPDSVTNPQILDSVKSVIASNASDYTDIVYKASGGNSAVENMIANAKIGENSTCEGGTRFKRLAESIGDVTDFKCLTEINLSDFTIDADGTSESSDKLELATSIGLKVYCNKGDDFRFSRQLNLSNQNTEIEVNGRLFWDANVEFGIFGSSLNEVSLSGSGVIEQTTPYVNQLLLNRALRTESCNSQSIKGLELKGWKTARSVIGGTFDLVENIRLTNIYGTDPQEGYGQNSSARIQFINGITWDNTDIPGNGRHVVYVNGGARFATVSKVHADTCLHNPINVAIPDIATEGVITISDITAVRCLTTPLSATTGIVNVTGSTPDAPELVTLTIKNVSSELGSGHVVSLPSKGFSGAKIQDISEKQSIQDETGTYSAFAVVYLRGVKNPNVSTITSDGIADANGYVLVARDTESLMCEKVATTGNTGTSIVRLQDTTDSRVGSTQGSIAELTLVGSNTNALRDTYRNIETPVIPIVSGNINVGNANSVIVSDTGDISTIQGDFDGQVVVIIANNGSLTIKNNNPGVGSIIETASGADVVLGLRKTIQLIQRSNRWLQI